MYCLSVFVMVKEISIPQYTQISKQHTEWVSELNTTRWTLKHIQTHTVDFDLHVSNLNLLFICFMS